MYNVKLVERGLVTLGHNVRLILHNFCYKILGSYTIIDTLDQSNGLFLHFYPFIIVAKKTQTTVSNTLVWKLGNPHM